jgi:hypothetical protein
VAKKSLKDRIVRRRGHPFFHGHPLA